MLGFLALTQPTTFPLSCLISGSHHIFKHPDVIGIVNIQNRKGKVQPYQIRQFLALVEENSLTLEQES